MQTAINFVGSPTDVHGVLRHLQTRCRHAASIHRFARCKEHFVFYKQVDGFWCAAHIRHFAHAKHLIFNQFSCIIAIEFVLCGARQRHINFHLPRLASSHKFCAETLGIGRYHIVARGAQFEHIVDFFARNAIFVVDIAIRTRNSYHFCAQLRGFGYRAPRHIAEARHRHSFAFERMSRRFEHLIDKVECAKTRCLGAYERAAKFESFACQHARIFACQFFVHAVEIANFACAHANVASRHIGIGANLPPEFEHKGLAKTHHFGIGFTFRVEIGAAFAAAHGQCGERIFESLFEAEKLQNREIDRWVKTQTAFVWADGVVELNAVAEVGLHLAAVVGPRHAKHIDAVGLDHAFDDFCLFELGVPHIDLLDREQHLAHRLQILALARVFSLERIHQILNIHSYNDLRLCPFR